MEVKMEPWKENIVEWHRRMNELVEKYPNNIPVEAAAAFLGIGLESLRAYLMQADNDLGIFWRQPGASVRSFCIPTARFCMKFGSREEVYAILNQNGVFESA